MKKIERKCIAGRLTIDDFNMVDPSWIANKSLT
jgi:hypothetical protein